MPTLVEIGLTDQLKFGRPVPPPVFDSPYIDMCWLVVWFDFEQGTTK